VDGIYPRFAFFVAPYPDPQTREHRTFNRLQEALRKDVERLFGILTARFHIMLHPCRYLSVPRMVLTTQTVAILHNMVVECRRDGFVSRSRSSVYGGGGGGAVGAGAAGAAEADGADGEDGTADAGGAAGAGAAGGGGGAAGGGGAGGADAGAGAAGGGGGAASAGGPGGADAGTGAAGGGGDASGGGGAGSADAGAGAAGGGGGAASAGGAGGADAGIGAAGGGGGTAGGGGAGGADAGAFAAGGGGGGKRLRALSETAGVRGATGAAINARAAALILPARAGRSARRCAAVNRAGVPGAPPPGSWGGDLVPARPGADRHTPASRPASAAAKSPAKMAAARAAYVSRASKAAPAGAGW